MGLQVVLEPLASVDGAVRVPDGGTSSSIGRDGVWV